MGAASAVRALLILTSAVLIDGEGAILEVLRGLEQRRSLTYRLHARLEGLFEAKP